jgi:hypothetical protein
MIFYERQASFGGILSFDRLLWIVHTYSRQRAHTEQQVD